MKITTYQLTTCTDGEFETHEFREEWHAWLHVLEQHADNLDDWLPEEVDRQQLIGRAAVLSSDDEADIREALMGAGVDFTVSEVEGEVSDQAVLWEAARILKRLGRSHELIAAVTDAAEVA